MPIYVKGQLAIFLPKDIELSLGFMFKLLQRLADGLGMVLDVRFLPKTAK